MSLGALPGTAHAHGALRRSVPASGAHLSAAPRELRLTFNEPVELAVARLELRGPDDRSFSLSALRAGESGATVIADIVGPLTSGTYTVAWQIAGADGHPVRGKYRFTIAPGATGVAAVVPDTSTVVALADSSRPEAATHAAGSHHDPTAMPSAVAEGGFDAESPLYAAIRWLGFLGALGLVGAVCFSRVVLPRASRDPMFDLGASVLRGSEDAVRTFGVAAAAVFVIASLLRLAAQSVAMHGSSDALDLGLVATMVRETRWGSGWLLQLGGAVLAVVGLRSTRQTPVAWGGALAGVGVVVLAVGAALSGHAAAVPDLTAVAVASDAAHVVAAGGWLGTLLALAVVGLPVTLREPPDARGPAAAALVRAFSPVALACAGVVAVTGAAAAWWHLGAVDALWNSAYGRVLLLKLGAVTLVVATGAYNWRRVSLTMGDERGARRVLRSSTMELVVGAVVLVLTAVLVATPTAVVR